jgi:hypothetical protein
MEPSIGGRLDECHRTSEAQQGYLATEARNPTCNRLGQDRVDSRVVIERPMRPMRA